VLGNVGSQERREFAAIGDAVDLAKLLQENGEPGDVMLSTETAERVRPYYVVEPLAPIKTNDRADFTVMYRVTGTRS